MSKCPYTNFKDRVLDYINRTMKENGYGHLKNICFNPNDKLEIDGFNARSHAPYFLINIATREALAKAHTILAKTKYYDNMNKRYLDYLHIKTTTLKDNK